ncbi:RND efflux system, outer membrane lipoprotein CmeC [Candidatus Burkholderia humilis]|nr:RND efflux system, outer membrane lipoprotein CmeC [Candidatus Burkholderia humilis]
MLISQLDAPVALPRLPASIPIDTPASVLRRRPDVAAAEQRLHAATAQVGVVTAALFPRLTLTGMLETFAFHSDGMFRSQGESNLVALGIDWSFLDVVRVRARIKAANTDSAAALAQYQQTVLLALEDAENALIRLSRARSEVEYLACAAADSTRDVELARVRFQAGAIGLYEVLDAERTRLQNDEALADSRTRSIKSAVSVYKAVAGGWPQQLPERADVALMP